MNTQSPICYGQVMEPWEVKANRIISALCFAAWKAVNVKPNGKRYRKHRPYSVPELAQALVTCLGMRDRVAAEIEAKGLFLSYEGLEAIKGA